MRKRSGDCSCTSHGIRTQCRSVPLIRVIDFDLDFHALFNRFGETNRVVQGVQRADKPPLVFFGF